MLRRAFNLAVSWGWCSGNPALGIEKNREDPRERYLTAQELSKLFAALDEQSEKTSSNAIKFIALTGARKSEVLLARWDMFDLDAGVWMKPASFTKQRKSHRTPLSESALEILKEMSTEHSGPYVFPGRVAGEPLTDIKRTWIRACHRAGLIESVPQKTRRGEQVFHEDGRPATVTKPSVRIHDLRHTFASLLVSGGKSLPVIGALLGHSQTQTTQRYAHLYDDALRDATDQVGRQITRSK